jgi:hypothetical protein
LNRTESILLDEKWYWKSIGVFFRYRFIEKKTGIFEKNYPDVSITIDIDKYTIEYGKNTYTSFETPSNIIEHKDIVVLYCVDCLLIKGYKRKDIIIVNNEKDHDMPDIVVMDPSGSPFLAISCCKWGNKYEEGLRSFIKKKGDLFTYFKNNKAVRYLCIFSSYFDGGLPYKTYALYKMTNFAESSPLYYAGIFEDRIKAYKIAPFCTKHERKKEMQEIKKNLSNFPQINHFLVKDGEILKYTGKNSEISIPKPINSIGMGAFWDCSFLKSIKLNEGITRIGGDAFYKCESLEDLNIPSTVQEIGNDPFAGCPNLTLENNSKFFLLEDEVLYNKKKTEILHYSIKKEAKHFEIPNSVQYINKHTFYDNKFLDTLVIPESVIWMENNLFSGCKIKKVINKSPNFCVDNDGVIYNKEKSQVFSVFNHELKELLLPQQIQKIGKNSFFGCENLEHLHIPKNVAHIGLNPFVGCSKLTLTNESLVFTIENGMLIDKKSNRIKYCPNTCVKDTIEIPDFIEIIGRNSFCFCHNLKYIRIPNSVRLIERGAFAGCNNLESIEIPNSVKEIEKWVFSHCPQLKEIRIPKHTNLAEYMFTESPTQLIRY